MPVRHLPVGPIHRRSMWFRIITALAFLFGVAIGEPTRYIITMESGSAKADLDSLATLLERDYSTEVLAVYGSRYCPANLASGQLTDFCGGRLQCVQRTARQTERKRPRRAAATRGMAVRFGRS